MIMKNKKLLLIIFVVFALLTMSFVAYKILNKSDSQTTTSKIIANFQNGHVTIDEVNTQMQKLSSQNPQFATIDFNDLSSDQQQVLINEVVVQKVLYQKAIDANYNKDRKFKESVEQYKMDLLKQKYLSEIVQKNITNDAIKAQYDQLSEALKGKEDLRLRYIILDSESNANSVHAKLVKDPNSFADLAKANSIDTESARNGGDIGFVLEEALPKPIAVQAKALNNGAVSEAFQISDKWLIIKLEDRRPAKLNSFEEAKDGLAQRLSRQTVQEFIQRTILDANVVVVN
jgi:peptidyl-prolyl cis-trans isomerase C